MDQLKEYAVKAITDIIPLDRETCLEMIEYVLTLQGESAIQNHFLGFLGESEMSLSFIHNFIQQKKEIENLPKKVSQREKFNESHQEVQKVKEKQNVPVWGAKAQSSTTTSAKKPSVRLTRPKKAITTSQLLQNKDDSKQTTTRKAKKKNLDNLKDIESILTELELNDHSTDSHVIRVCNCMATRHPLFEVTPNCLNCGKIICAKEGLQPCSFCGNELLSHKEKSDILNILKVEREELEDKPKPKDPIVTPPPSSTAAKPKSKKIVISMQSGENLWKAQDKALKEADRSKKKAAEEIAKQEEERKEIEEQEREFKKYERTQLVDPSLLAAQERLETLLNFQATGAERTRIIDNASDFDAPGVSSGSMWLSPMERALQLKKQQRQMRKQKDSELQRTGRGKRVVEMVIKNGKVEMVEKVGSVSKLGISEGEEEADEADNDIKELEIQIKQTKGLEESKVLENVWDFKKDEVNWEKPTYVFSADVNAAQNTSISEKSLRPRVQFFNDSETNELLG